MSDTHWGFCIWALSKYNSKLIASMLKLCLNIVNNLHQVPPCVLQNTCFFMQVFKHLRLLIFRIMKILYLYTFRDSYCTLRFKVGLFPKLFYYLLIIFSLHASLKDCRGLLKLHISLLLRHVYLIMGFSSSEPEKYKERS